MLDTNNILVGASVFGLVLMVWLLGVMLVHMRQAARERAVRRRLGLSPPPRGTRVLRLWHDNQPSEMAVPDRRQVLPLRRRLEQIRQDAGLSLSVPSLALVLSGIGLMAGAVVYMTTSRTIAAVSAPVAVFIFFWAWIKKRISTRQRVFERQLMDAMELAARSLRAGSPLVGSFQLIGEEIDAPLGPIFTQIAQQQAMGEGLEQAIKQAATTQSSSDLKLFATSVVIQMRSGGNLADMMDRLAQVIRERIRLTRRVKVLTAQTQFSKRVLVALPFLLFATLNLINPRYMEPLYTTSGGKFLLLLTGVNLTLGVLLMNQMVKIKS